MNDIISRFDEALLDKMFQRDGKPYTARSALASCLKATSTVSHSYYDKHDERNWYDYTEEVTEPKPIRECLINLKVYKKQ